MKVYLDVSCLNRPFDNQDQARIRLETEALTMILKKCEQESWQQVSSEMAQFEIDAIRDSERRARVQLLLPEPDAVVKLTRAIYGRAETLTTLGLKPADAVHVAAAESLAAEVFLSCDDRLCRAARRCQAVLKVQVANPVDWLKEIGHELDA